MGDTGECKFPLLDLRFSGIIITSLKIFCDKIFLISYTFKDHLSSPTRLKGIRNLVTPDLLYALAAASEGELILLATDNFPSTKFTNGNRCDTAGPTVIRAGGLLIHTLLREIMKLIQVAS